MKKFLPISVLSIAIFVGMGFFNARTSNNEAGYLWYDTLQKAPLTPPNFVFGIAWSVLYVLIGLSFAFMLCNGIDQNLIDKKYFKLSLILFIIQFIVNLLWSYLFWTFRNPLFALIDIVILDVLVLITIIMLSKVSKFAVILLIPYMLWILFATYLNFYTVLYN